MLPTPERAAPRPNPGRGFTLIEICIALFLALTLFSIAAGIVKMGVRDTELARLRDEAGLLVLRTRALAMESGREMKLRVDGEGLVLDTAEDSKPFPRTLAIPPGVKFEVQVWPDDRWISPRDKNTVDWVFQPNGICMPLSLRFTQGASFISFRIHPLTGAVDQESRVIAGDAR
ncbi:MAG: hypothetical protein SFU85_06175 [Candidatus Methylacidiphilales bacterium]|nr:hypothetical protein [Candidatus Methylacidiphilales bacterium]